MADCPYTGRFCSVATFQPTCPITLCQYYKTAEHEYEWVECTMEYLNKAKDAYRASGDAPGYYTIPGVIYRVLVGKHTNLGAVWDTIRIERREEKKVCNKCGKAL